MSVNVWHMFRHKNRCKVIRTWGPITLSLQCLCMCMSWRWLICLLFFFIHHILRATKKRRETNVMTVLHNNSYETTQEITLQLPITLLNFLLMKMHTHTHICHVICHFTTNVCKIPQKQGSFTRYHRAELCHIGHISSDERTISKLHVHGIEWKQNL